LIRQLADYAEFLMKGPYVSLPIHLAAMKPSVSVTLLIMRFLGSVILLLLTDATASGQLLPRVTPIQPPVVSIGEKQITRSIHLPKLTGHTLVGLYRKFTGRRVLLIGAASDAEFSFVQEASPANAVSYSRAAQNIRRAAASENFVFVPDADDSNLDRLTLSHTGPWGSEGTAVYIEGDSLPAGDAVISYLMMLQHIQPKEAVEILSKRIGEPAANPSLAPVPEISAVVVIGGVSQIRRIIGLKKEIDKP
jgi:hypothetical protein